MELPCFSNQIYHQTDFRTGVLPKSECEGCRFSGCDSTSCGLGSCQFADGDFEQCNLSLVKLPKTVLRNPRFRDCKLLGAPFYNCDSFFLRVRFEGCLLDHASFDCCKIPGTVFERCQLREADFAEAQLREARVPGCDLLIASFEGADLKGADLSGALRCSIDPDAPRIGGARIAFPGLAGLLNKHGILIEGLE